MLPSSSAGVTVIHLLMSVTVLPGLGLGTFALALPLALPLALALPLLRIVSNCIFVHACSS